MDPNFFFLLPPVAFLLILGLAALFSALSSRMACPAKSDAPGKNKPYACGEDVENHRARPEYRQFFHFAFFFTIMHVVALMVTTLPSGNLMAMYVAILYLVAATIGLFILYRS